MITADECVYQTVVMVTELCRKRLRMMVVGDVIGVPNKASSLSTQAVRRASCNLGFHETRAVRV